MKKLFSVLFITLLICCNTCLAAEVIVTGVGSDKSSALQDAFRNAVEQSVGLMVDSETLVNNAVVIEDSIYTHAIGFVKNYNILSEQLNGDMVVLRVNVNVDNNSGSLLDHEIKKIISKMENPRIAVAIAETHSRGNAANKVAETAINKALIGVGFTHVVDPAYASHLHDGGLLVQFLASGDVSIVYQARKMGYDYLILGDSYSENVGRIYGSNMYSSRARLDIKILKVATGELIAAEGIFGAGADIATTMSGLKATENAAIQVAELAVQKILSTGQNINGSLQLHINNLTSFDQVQRIVNVLQKERGIEGVYIRNYEDGKAIVDVDGTFTHNSLLRCLEKELPFKINVTERSKATLRLRVG